MTNPKNDIFTLMELSEFRSLMELKATMQIGNEYIIKTEIKKNIYTRRDKKEYIPAQIYFLSTDTLYIYTLKEAIKRELTSEKEEEKKEFSFNISLSPLRFKSKSGKTENINFYHILELISQPQNEEYFSQETAEKIKNILKWLKKQDKNKIKKILQKVTGQKLLVELHESYSAMLNGTATNKLMHINTNSIPPMLNIITGNATIEQGSLKIFIDKYSELKGVRTSTLKLLDICTMYLTKQNNYRGKEKEVITGVSIPIEQYMKLCGIPFTKPSKDKTRCKIKEDLETLYHISLEWTESSGKYTKDFAKMRICDKVAISRGNITFNFSKEMAKYLTNAYIMQYPMELLKVDERNSNLYPLGRKILLHFSINNNKKKGTSNIISIKSLLEVCPDIPTYEKVMNEGRQLDQRIKIPFEKALNSLPFIQWEYSNTKGIPLTEKQIISTDYKTFEHLYIRFEVMGFPGQTIKLTEK